MFGCRYWRNKTSYFCVKSLKCAWFYGDKQIATFFRIIFQCIFAFVATNSCNFRAASCPTGLSRTVIFLKYQSEWGEHLFYRGGIDYARRPRKHNTKQYTHVARLTLLTCVWKLKIETIIHVYIAKLAVLWNRWYLVVEARFRLLLYTVQLHVCMMLANM